MIELQASVAELRSNGLLSGWSRSECEAMLRQQAPNRPLHPRDLESLLARHYSLGLGARSKSDKVLILSTAGRMGYVPDRPLIACLSRLTSEVAVRKDTDHSGVLLDCNGGRHPFDLIRGLCSITAAFNAALAAAGEVRRVWQSHPLRHRGDDSLLAWLVRDPAQISGTLVPEIFAADLSIHRRVKVGERVLETPKRELLVGAARQA
jgi:hypothetical protein